MVTLGNSAQTDLFQTSEWNLSQQQLRFQHKQIIIPRIFSLEWGWRLKSSFIREYEHNVMLHSKFRVRLMCALRQIRFGFRNVELKIPRGRSHGARVSRFPSATRGSQGKVSCFCSYKAMPRNRDITLLCFLTLRTSLLSLYIYRLRGKTK